MRKLLFIALFLSIFPAKAFLPPVAIVAVGGSVTYTSIGTLVTTVGGALTALYYQYSDDADNLVQLAVDFFSGSQDPSPQGISGIPLSSSGGFITVGTFVPGDRCNLNAVITHKQNGSVLTYGSGNQFGLGALNCGTYTNDSGQSWVGPPTQGNIDYHYDYYWTCTNCTVSGRGVGTKVTTEESIQKSNQSRGIDSSIANQLAYVEQSNGQFVIPQTDVDYSTYAPQSPAIPKLNQQGALVSQYPTDQGLATLEVTPANQGVQLKEYYQTDTETVTETTISIDSGGNVASGNSQTYQGTVQPLPEPLDNVLPVYQPVTTTTGEPPTQPELQFPTDYARQGEAAAAAQSITTALLQGDLVTPEVPDTEMPWFGSTFDGVLPTINTSGATCPVWQFDALGESFYIDHHCQLIVDFNPLFYAMFTAFWVLLAFRTVLEA